MLLALAAVRSLASSFIFETGTMALTSSSVSPRASPRLASGSTSAARTFRPSSAYSRHRVEAKVVFPTPPLPVIATFISTTSGNSFLFLERKRNKKNFLPQICALLYIFLNNADNKGIT